MVHPICYGRNFDNNNELDLLLSDPINAVIKMRNKDRIFNMNAIRLELKWYKDLVKNMNTNTLERKRRKDLVEHMKENRLQAKRRKDVVEHMTEERLQAKRRKDVVERMKKDLKEKNLQVQNMNTERINKCR
ncbi:hypothetical protein TSAR_008572 [Trichomalopsis sarcophagae]|uniref:Uncharacterized protein n=1 Tax=Trichomalopsis sarcophagae TaxID=543379 RepID=A0A232EG72_9HYME|nr:hypothetical protein TSAR_008572 [Trichomalopsis sarcophagae]